MIQAAKSRSKEAGFSLTELVLVIVGGTIIMVAATPALTRVLDSYRVVLAAQGIASQLQFARMKSVSSNESFRVEFPSGTNQYLVSSGAAGGEVIAGPFFLPRNISWVGVPFNATSGKAVFLPTGNVPAGGNGSAQIQNAAGRTFTIAVDIGGVIRQTSP